MSHLEEIWGHRFQLGVRALVGVTLTNIRL